MDVDKQHLRHCILFCFQMKKNAAQAMELINSTLGEHSVSHSTVKKWFARFRNGNLNLDDDPRPGAIKKFENEELKALLDKNPCQTQEELAEQLGVTPQAISLRLHAMGMVQKEANWASTPKKTGEKRKIENARAKSGAVKTKSGKSEASTADL